ncbi:MAG: isocitrate lyase/phosphoenolpyruvate mutase family protein [Vicinamibacterales bacterium]
MTSTFDKGARFRDLHRQTGAFVMANAWDAGSARVLAGLGFPALATSSAACANVFGRRDGFITRDEALSHARAIVDATDVPVSADLERGFGDDPDAVAETVRLAAATGLVGCSIEDATGRHDSPIEDIEIAAARVAAAASAARGLGTPFTLTARAENFLHGRDDLDDTIRRLQAYERAGADVLFAPGLPSLDAVRRVCAAVSAPVSFMVAIPKRSFTKAELEAAGVKRISLASSLYRAAMTGVFAAAREVIESGTFTYVERAITSAEFGRFMRD